MLLLPISGFSLEGKFRLLGEFRQPSGKRVIAFAMEGDVDAAAVKSNTFTMEWPPKSGRMAEFPEIDRAAWFGLDDAAHMILKGQRPIVKKLLELYANSDCG